MYRVFVLHIKVVTLLALKSFPNWWSVHGPSKSVTIVLSTHVQAEGRTWPERRGSSTD